MELLKSLPARLLMVILLLQAVAYYAIAYRSEVIPAMAPLASFPRICNGWIAAQDFPMEKDVEDVLRADDTLNRVYVSPGDNASASLFIAFFKTQRYGQSPHSPKNCLPGSGWQAEEDRTIPIQVPGRGAPIRVNEYVIARDESRSVVLYWYQSHSRIIAKEVEAKFWLVADAIRYHRSDTALVRIVVPILNNDRDTAVHTATVFARAVYPGLVRQLPR